ncbi:MAG: hypothetical protein ACLFNB_03190 [Candidatus Woesearchaeota archaeon]
MALSTHFWNTLAGYVKPEDRVAEIYHGEKDDVLRRHQALSRYNELYMGLTN